MIVYCFDNKIWKVIANASKIWAMAQPKPQFLKHFGILAQAQHFEITLWREAWQKAPLVIYLISSISRKSKSSSPLPKSKAIITYEEINEILPMTFDSAEQIDQVLIFLSGMDIQVLNQAEVERQKERKKEAKELEGIAKRPEGTSDDPVRMYLKEMGSVPLLTREEEVEISKRIEKAQIQIEKIIMRFRYSTREAISIANYLITGKERFDKIIAEKEVADKQAYSQSSAQALQLLQQEDAVLGKSSHRSAADPKLKKDRQGQDLGRYRKMPHPHAGLFAPDALPP